MAVLSLAFLKALSYKGARDLLLQEGYVKEEIIDGRMTWEDIKTEWRRIKWARQCK